MSLQGFVNKRVVIITTDGRTLVGNLLSCDQTTNIVLSQTTERIIRTPDDPEASTEVDHGLYLMRGDTICIIGPVDEELDSSIDWTRVKGQIIGGVKHT